MMMNERGKQGRGGKREEGGRWNGVRCNLVNFRGGKGGVGAITVRRGQFDPSYCELWRYFVQNSTYSTYSTYSTVDGWVCVEYSGRNRG